MISRYLRRGIKTAVRRIVPCHIVAWTGSPHDNQLALTFDDGPHPLYTPRILATLREAGVPATFFVLGSQAEQHPEIIAAMIKDGHELGNHTYSHANLGQINWRHGCDELRAADQVLRNQDGRFQGLFRPPWGWMGLGGALYSIRYRCQAAMWSVDSRDYLLDGTQPLIERMQAASIRAGDILLFHDDSQYTAEALGPILQDLLCRGFSFATASKLLGATPEYRPSVAAG
jgi:peptidoglycan-N-acetylglucosamine deacetylase